MCDDEHEHVVSVKFEGNQVRELRQERLANRNWSGLSSWPDGVLRWRFLETFHNFVESFEESVAPAWTPLLIPECSGTNLGASFRMKFDAHDDQQVRSGFPHVHLPMARATLALPERRPIDEEVH